MSRGVRISRPTLLLLLSYLAFISLGLPDTVFGVAWPSLREGFGLSPSAMGAVLGAGLLGYFCSGLVAGRLSAALGVGGRGSSAAQRITTSVVCSARSHSDRNADS